MPDKLSRNATCVYARHRCLDTVSVTAVPLEAPADADADADGDGVEIFDRRLDHCGGVQMTSPWHLDSIVGSSADVRRQTPLPAQPNGRPGMWRGQEVRKMPDVARAGGVGVEAQQRGVGMDAGLTVEEGR